MRKKGEVFPSIGEDDIEKAFREMGEMNTIDESLNGVKKIISELDTIKLDLRK